MRPRGSANWPNASRPPSIKRFAPLPHVGNPTRTFPPVKMVRVMSDALDSPSVHVPVLPEEVCSLLLACDPEVAVDCTLGLAGHARLLLERSPRLRLIGLDVDSHNLSAAAERLAPFAGRIQLVKANFADLREVLTRLQVEGAGAILADLGVSSNQISDPQKGLSFEVDGPLDMRLDENLTTTAADLVNGLPEGELADLLYLQSQERLSRKISKRICQVRRQGRINSTVQLARLVAFAVGQNPDAHRGRIHPATRTFMALRMAVNREAASLQRLLAQAPDCLRAGGRIGVISFHSGEDRLVKDDFRTRSRAGIYELVTKKPICAGEVESATNPRSRSAKLRVAQRESSP